MDFRGDHGSLTEEVDKERGRYPKPFPHPPPAPTEIPEHKENVPGFQHGLHGIKPALVKRSWEEEGGKHLSEEPATSSCNLEGSGERSRSGPGMR